ncbi:hypothetical protein C8R48DRAFT_374668 [Suillus tomentosus]|nr:hypothetical protein C8R48DRAFT_374668 [Suillus tomentosus]
MYICLETTFDQQCALNVEYNLGLIDVDLAIFSHASIFSFICLRKLLLACVSQSSLAVAFLRTDLVLVLCLHFFLFAFTSP